MTSSMFSSSSTSFDARFDFLLYWIATRSKAPTANGSGYHFVGVSVQAFMSFSGRSGADA